MNEEKLSLNEHLEELRWRCLRVLIVLLVTSSLSLFFARPLLRLLILPLGQSVYLSPVEPLLVHLKLILFSGLTLTFPYFLWETWSFVSKGLLPKEKRYFFIYLPFALSAFFSGVCLAFLVLLPLTLQFIFRLGSDTLQPMISIGQYLSFVSKLLLSVGVLFECPVVVLFLSHSGLLPPSFLIEKWRYILVFIFVLGAVLTPPDVLSQFLMTLPILLLYGVSIFLSHLGWRLRGKGRLPCK